MGRPAVTEAEIIQMTLENVRSFYNRNPSVTTMPMTDDFVWIGSNDFQWCEGLEEFYRVTKKEYEEPPVMLTDEEYHLLFHERNVWVVYGRYKVTATLEEGSVIHAHVRGTYVWRRINGELKLAHVHGSHAQDIPLNQILPPPKPLTVDTRYFEYMKHMDTLKADSEKLEFRDIEKNYHYLFPYEILFLKAALQQTVVYTTKGEFRISGLLAENEKKLPEIFRRIHKSYIVNTMFIDHICRYQVFLKDGRKIPVSRDQYMELKKYLKPNNRDSSRQ